MITVNKEKDVHMHVYEWLCASTLAVLPVTVQLRKDDMLVGSRLDIEYVPSEPTHFSHDIYFFISSWEENTKL